MKICPSNIPGCKTVELSLTVKTETANKFKSFFFNSNVTIEEVTVRLLRNWISETESELNQSIALQNDPNVA